MTSRRAADKANSTDKIPAGRIREATSRKPKHHLPDSLFVLRTDIREVKTQEEMLTLRPEVLTSTSTDIAKAGASGTGTAPKVVLHPLEKVKVKLGRVNTRLPPTYLSP